MLPFTRLVASAGIGRLPDLWTGACCGPQAPALTADSAGGRALGEPVFHREQRRLGPRGHTELGVDVLEVRRHGLARDGQVGGDFTVRPAAGERNRDVRLA